MGQRDAGPAARVRRDPGDVALVEDDGAALGPQTADQEVERGGLARAVRPDDPERLPRRDREA